MIKPSQHPRDSQCCEKLSLKNTVSETPNQGILAEKTVSMRPVIGCSPDSAQGPLFERAIWNPPKKCLDFYVHKVVNALNVMRLKSAQKSHYILLHLSLKWTFWCVACNGICQNVRDVRFKRSQHIQQRVL